MQAADRSPKKTLEPRDSRDVEPTSDPAMEPEGGGLLERRQESVMGGLLSPRGSLSALWKLFSCEGSTKTPFTYTCSLMTKKKKFFPQNL